MIAAAVVIDAVITVGVAEASVRQNASTAVAGISPGTRSKDSVIHSSIR